MDIKSLIIVVNNRRYDPKDFVEIASRTARNATDIKVFVVGAGSSSLILPADTWRRATLAVAFDQIHTYKPLRGRLLIGKLIGKLEQLDIMRRARVSVPHALPFKVGMELDPALWGEFVVLKPVPIEASSHDGVQLFRSSKLRGMSLDDFPEEHLIHKQPMMVQKFVDTGEFPSKYRALTLCGEPIYIQHTIISTPRPPLDAADEALEAAAVGTGGAERTYHHLDYPDVFAFAKRMAAAFPDIPLLGCDVVKDVNTDKLYALEVNPGGNVWHFSSRMWAKRRKLFPDVVKDMHAQFGAFDAAARALIHATRRLAI